MSTQDEHPILLPYLVFLTIFASSVLIGVVARLFRPSFSLVHWIFGGFPQSALHPATWGKEAITLAGAGVITVLVVWLVLGVRPFSGRR